MATSSRPFFIWAEMASTSVCTRSVSVASRNMDVLARLATRNTAAISLLLLLRLQKKKMKKKKKKKQQKKKKQKKKKKKKKKK